MSLFDIVSSALGKSSKATNELIEEVLGEGQGATGGQRDEEGELTEEGESLFAPVWDTENDTAQEDFFEGRYNEKFTKFGTDNPVLNPGGQLSDPGNFLTSDELSQDDPSTRSLMAAMIALTFGYGSVAGGGTTAAEGGTAAGSAGGASTAGGATTGASTGVAAEGGALTAGEVAAAGSETGTTLAPATGASEGSSGSLTGDILQDYGTDTAQALKDQQEQSEAEARQAKELANQQAVSKVKQTAYRSNLNVGDILAEEPISEVEPEAGLQLTETENPIPIQPTPQGEPGPDSVVTTETPEGRTTTYKSEGKAADTPSPYGSNDALESLAQVNKKDSEGFYNNLLGAE